MLFIIKYDKYITYMNLKYWEIYFIFIWTYFVNVKGK